MGLVILVSCVLAILFRFCIHVIKNTMRPEVVSYEMPRTRSQGSKNGGLGGLSRMSTQNSNLSWSRGASNQASTKRNGIDVNGIQMKLYKSKNMDNRVHPEQSPP